MNNLIRGAISLLLIAAVNSVYAAEYYLQAGIDNASSSDLKSNSMEYAFGYQFNRDWAIEIRTGDSFRSSAPYQANSQTAIQARYTLEIATDLDWYFSTGYQKMRITSADGVADQIYRRETSTGLLLGAGFGYTLAEEVILTGQYRHNDGLSWSESVSSYFVGVSYAF